MRFFGFEKNKKTVSVVNQITNNAYPGPGPSPLSLENWAPDMLTLLSAYLTTNDIGRISKSCRAYSKLMWSRLAVLHFEHPHSIWDEHLTSLSKRSTVLQKLILKDCYHITNQSLCFLALNLEYLWYVDLSGCTKIGDPGVSFLAMQRNIRYLDLSGCYWVTNNGIEKIVQRHKLLQTFKIKGSEIITDEAIEELQTLPRLTHLSLRDCPNFTPAILPKLLKFPALKVVNLKSCLSLLPVFAAEEPEHKQLVHDLTSHFVKCSYSKTLL